MYKSVIIRGGNLSCNRTVLASISNIYKTFTISSVLLWEGLEHLKSLQHVILEYFKLSTSFMTLIQRHEKNSLWPITKLQHFLANVCSNKSTLLEGPVTYIWYLFWYKNAAWETWNLFFFFKCGKLVNIWRGGPNVRTLSCKYMCVTQQSMEKTWWSGCPQVSLTVKIAFFFFFSSFQKS